MSTKGKAVPAGAVWLDFRSDGTVTLRAGSLVYNGTYSLGLGKSVSISLDKELAGRKNHAETIEIHGTHLTMTDSDGTEMKFYRE